MAESEGISTRYLLGAFFAVVLLCAVFFSLGYFLGYREGHPGGAPQIEAVGASADSPAPAGSSGGSSAAPSSVQPNGAEPTEAESGSASDSANGSQPVQENASSSQSDATTAANTASSSPAGAASAASVEPAAESESPRAPSIDSGTASSAEDDSIYPRSLPSGVLIQVGAVANRQEASRMADVLRSRGYPALVLTPSLVGAKDTFFRVVAGPYRTRIAAGSALKDLTKAGYRPFIRQ